MTGAFAGRLDCTPPGLGDSLWLAAPGANVCA
jgi:hypothetical protein